MGRRVDILKATAKAILITSVVVLAAVALYVVFFGKIDSSLVLGLIDRVLSIDWDAGIRRVFTVLFLWEALKAKKQIYARLGRLSVWPWAEPFVAFLMSIIALYFMVHILIRV